MLALRASADAELLGGTLRHLEERKGFDERGLAGASDGERGKVDALDAKLASSTLVNLSELGVVGLVLRELLRDAEEASA